VLYVEDLIGPETVNTMPEETIQAFQDHGEVALTLERDLDEAHAVFERVAEAGVDYDDVVAVLEREGVEKFSDSFTELLDGVRSKRGELVSA
jgi:transaldolase